MNCNYDGQFQLLSLIFIEKVRYDKNHIDGFQNSHQTLIL